MIEVEMKLELAPRSHEKLRDVFDFLPTVEFINQTDQVDSYYDTPHYSCFQQAVFLRMRNQTSLEMKYHEVADPLHTQCIERVFPLLAEPHVVEELNQLGARFIVGWRKTTQVKEALALNQLSEFVRIEKRRRHYRYEDILLCIDSIPGLGHFIELEIACKEEQDVTRAYDRLQEVRAHFALSSLRVIHLGYVELWLRRYWPHIYQLMQHPHNGAQKGEIGVQRSNSIPLQDEHVERLRLSDELIVEE